MCYNLDYLCYELSTTSVLESIYKTGFNWSQPVVNQSQSELVKTSLVTEKDQSATVQSGFLQVWGK